MVQLKGLLKKWGIIWYFSYITFPKFIILTFRNYSIKLSSAAQGSDISLHQQPMSVASCS